MSYIIKFKDKATKTEGYVDYEKIERLIPYLNAYLASNRYMDLKTYKSIINRITGLNISLDLNDDKYGFMSDNYHDVFYLDTTELTDSDEWQPEELRYHYIYQLSYRSL